MRSPYLLVAALVALALFFGWEARQALDEPVAGADNAARASGPPWQPALTPPNPPPPPEVGPLIAVVTARPLFRRDRQPFREGSAGAAARNYDAELSRYTLLGVLSFGKELTALVVSKTGGRTDRWEVKAGETIPGFTVKEVRPDGLLVTADDREFQLPLYAGSPTAAGGAVRTEGGRVAPPPAAAPASAGTAQPPPVAAPPAPTARPQPATPVSPRERPRYVPGRR
jgi:hypothetical protein